MVSFNWPELADQQAADIRLRSPDDGEAWAVGAYMVAKQSLGGAHTAMALVNAQRAVSLAPEDPFVLRTAAQLVAWYDVRADKSQISAAARDAAEAMRLKLAGDPIYAEAYAQAHADDAKMAGASASQPAPATASAGATGAGQPYLETVPVAPPPAYAAAPAGPIYVPYPQYVPYPVYVPYPEPYAGASGDGYWYPSEYGGIDLWPSYAGGWLILGDSGRYRGPEVDRGDRARELGRGGRLIGPNVPRAAAPPATWSVPRSYSGGSVSIPRYTPAPASFGVPSSGLRLSMPSLGGVGGGLVRIGGGLGGGLGRSGAPGVGGIGGGLSGGGMRGGRGGGR